MSKETYLNLTHASCSQLHKPISLLVRLLHVHVYQFAGEHTKASIRKAIKVIEIETCIRFKIFNLQSTLISDGSVKNLVVFSTKGNRR